MCCTRIVLYDLIKILSNTYTPRGTFKFHSMYVRYVLGWDYTKRQCTLLLLLFLDDLG